MSVHQFTFHGYRITLYCGFRDSVQWRNCFFIFSQGFRTSCIFRTLASTAHTSVFHHLNSDVPVNWAVSKIWGCGKSWATGITQQEKLNANLSQTDLNILSINKCSYSCDRFTKKIFLLKHDHSLHSYGAVITWTGLKFKTQKPENTQYHTAHQLHTGVSH